MQRVAQRDAFCPWVRGGHYGVNIVSVAPDTARGVPAVYASYTLSDATNGAPLALLDGGEITARRGAAASALVARS